MWRVILCVLIYVALCEERSNESDWDEENHKE